MSVSSSFHPPLSLLSAYQEHFKSSPRWVRAPGRINLIGEHTDYNLGYVFPAAIDRFMWLGFGESKTEGITVVAADLNEKAHFLPGSFDDHARGWLKYLQALIMEAQAKGLEIPSMEGVLGGNIPVGAGLSSSAAMGTGLIYWIYLHNGREINLMDIARIAQAAEHRIGVNCGIMDQFAVLHGKSGQAVRLDCLNLSFQYAPLDLDEYLLVLINTNVKHELSGTAYNDRRASCEQIVAALKDLEPGVKTLRDVTENMIEKHRDALDPEGIQRVTFVLRENARVLATSVALENGEYDLFGELLYQSHEGLSQEYEVSCGELDLLVELAKEEPAVLGARMVGGGFGGCTLNLMLRSQWEETSARMAATYQSQTGLVPDIYPVTAADGVGEWLEETVNA
ncbi:MAG: galactokinase [Bacteroidia bacterium]|nr:galactokinase [Bacteroidia bacterium]